MTSTARAQPEARAARRRGKPGRPWLLFVHQLPARSSNLRVRTWRRLQQLGAVPLKQAVYVLPDTAAAREDFEWLKTEIEAAGGDAGVFAANSVDAWSDDALVEEFRRTRQAAYAAVASDIERVLRMRSPARRRRGTRAPALRRLLHLFTERMSAVERIDFFGSAGRDRVSALLRELEEKASDVRSPAGLPGTAAGLDGMHYANRLWVTRPRPGVDRMASAWLIKRFVDPQARFAFAADRESVPRNGVPFDMFGVEFSHHGDGCTFETLCAVFTIQQPAVARIAAIVHDLDLKDGRFAAQEEATVGTLIEGMQLSVAEDDELLNLGIALFDSLYRAFERSARSDGPRPVARPRARAPAPRRKGPTPPRRTG